MIKSITIRGFKSIQQLRIELRPLNIVIGANGSGKSNVLELFSLIHAVENGRLSEYTAIMGGAERLLHFGSKVTKRLEIEVHGQGQYGEITAWPAANDTLHAETSFGPLSELGGEVVRSRRWHLADSSPSALMRKKANVQDNRYLRQNGSNLAPFLYLLSQRYRDSYQMIRNAVRRTAPFIHDFQLSPDRINPETIMLEWRHDGSDQYFGVSDLSDGTLRYIALATVLLQPEEFLPPLVLLDEPELGLHPAAIGVLSALIKQAAHRTQLIVSTQSPQLLDQFEPEDVLVADRIENATQLRRLDRAELGEWLQDYSLGQLWEKNELGGRPTPV